MNIQTHFMDISAIRMISDEPVNLGVPVFSRVFSQLSFLHKAFVNFIQELIFLKPSPVGIVADFLAQGERQYRLASCSVQDSGSQAVNGLDFAPLLQETATGDDTWEQNHCRYFMIADITIRVESDLAFSCDTFSEKFKSFATGLPGNDMVFIHHHFGIPEFRNDRLGEVLYRRSPWEISLINECYVYRGISPTEDFTTIHRIAVCSIDHVSTRIYNDEFLENDWLKGNLQSLTMFSSDQLLIAYLLADRNGFYLHSAGVIVDGSGMLFVGHSEAGKSTTTNFLIQAGLNGRLDVEVLCDDRNIVRRKTEGWWVYGTWSHGDIPLVSSASAPLKAICFIEKAAHNRIDLLEDRNEVVRRLLAGLVRPFMTADWLEKTIDNISKLVSEVPCYRMQFDLSGEIVNDIKGIATGDNIKRS